MENIFKKISADDDILQIINDTKSGSQNNAKQQEISIGGFWDRFMQIKIIQG